MVMDKHVSSFLFFSEIDESNKQINKAHDRIDALYEYLGLEYVKEEVETSDDFEERSYARKVTKK
jgi:ribosome assembly protein YihI (activator of Der GTPase)